MPENPSAPNCFQCLYYKVSGNPRLPHVCTLYGLHTIRRPSFEIRSALAQDCSHFEHKPLPQPPEENKPEGPGWIA